MQSRPAQLLRRHVTAMVKSDARHPSTRGLACGFADHPVAISVISPRPSRSGRTVQAPPCPSRGLFHRSKASKPISACRSRRIADGREHQLVRMHGLARRPPIVIGLRCPEFPRSGKDTRSPGPGLAALGGRLRAQELERDVSCAGAQLTTDRRRQQQRYPCDRRATRAGSGCSPRTARRWPSTPCRTSTNSAREVTHGHPIAWTTPASDRRPRAARDRRGGCPMASLCRGSDQSTTMTATKAPSSSSAVVRRGSSTA